MKRTFQFFALVAICSAMMVSCKNNKTTEPNQEEIQAQKVALADSVLAQIDAIFAEFCDYADNSFRLPKIELTEDEKMVKPDYLLDPSEVDRFVTKYQKINAFAIYSQEIWIRTIYDMPSEETKEAILKLAAEINIPCSEYDVNKTLRSTLKKDVYEECKKNGKPADFWQFEHALMIQISYIMAQNPELFFNRITDEGWANFMERSKVINDAIGELAKYDEEMALIRDIMHQTSAYSSEQERCRVNATRESAKQYRIANKDKFIAKRNALLQ